MKQLHLSEGNGEGISQIGLVVSVFQIGLVVSVSQIGLIVNDQIYYLC